MAGLDGGEGFERGGLEGVGVERESERVEESVRMRPGIDLLRSGRSVVYILKRLCWMFRLRNREVWG